MSIATGDEPLRPGADGARDALPRQRSWLALYGPFLPLLLIWPDTARLRPRTDLGARAGHAHRGDGEHCFGW